MRRGGRVFVQSSTPESGEASPSKATGAVGPLFRHLEDFFGAWLEGAQPVEIRRLLELAGEELARRGQTLTWAIAPRRNAEGLGR